MKIVLSPRSEKQLYKINKIDQIALTNKLRKLSSKTNITNATKLKGHKNIFRTRVGDYRVIYKKTNSLVYVIIISHRKDVYKIVNRIFK